MDVFTRDMIVSLVTTDIHVCVCLSYIYQLFNKLTHDFKEFLETIYDVNWC